MQLQAINQVQAINQADVLTGELAGLNQPRTDTSAPGIEVEVLSNGRDGDRNDTWVSTRQIWNQHAYSINNVNDDGTIPSNPDNSWQTHNTFRLNAFPEGGGNALAAPDLIPSYVRLEDSGTDTTITARIGNGGSQFVAAGVNVSFYDSDPRNGGVLLGTTQTTQRLDIGAFEDVSLTVPADSVELNNIWVVADDDGTGRGFVTECDEENNVYHVGSQSGEPAQPVDNRDPEFTTTAPEAAPANQLLRYDANAQDADGDILTYDLSLAPDGMAIEPTSGRVVWEPAIAQIGTHDVILRVQDGNGGVDLQSFQVTVGNNSAPVITSRPIGPTIANQPYTYDVDAEDVDSDILTYSLLANPGNVTIDPVTGVLSWTPTDSDVGNNNFIRVQVADGQGGIDTQSFSLPVIASTAVNNPPVITNAPRNAIGLGDDYVYQIEASDPDNDALTYSLTDAPDGMTIDATGLITWPAAETQLGDYSFTVRVEDSRDAAVEATYTLSVEQQTANQAPTITSTPSFVATIGDQYIYEAKATDPDNDPIAWALVSGPEGLTLNETTGRVSWIPTADQFGFHQVIIDAVDAQGASVRQGFGLNVSSTNAPPVITSPPLTLAISNADYNHRIEAIDPNGDALTYSLIAAPNGMSIDEATGQIAWTPTSGQQGTQQVTVSVADGRGGLAEQTYTVDVIGDAPNQPPQFTSRPAFEATANQGYLYQMAATDPENLILRYELLDGPNGMTVDGTMGVLTWTPTADQIGPHTVEVAAFDPLDLGASQTFTLTVGNNNQKPVRENEPVKTAVANQLYAYDLKVTDFDGDTVTYTLENGPDGMTVDELGRVRWTPTVDDVGTVLIQINFQDEQGPAEFVKYNLNVIADTTAPQVALVVSENPIDINEPVTVQVQAVDDVAIDSIGLNVDGEDVALDGNGTVTLEFDAFGNVSLVATALDTSGNEASTNLNLSVVNTSDVTAPVVSITTPGTGDSITSFVDVIGTVDDPDDNLTSYTLTATPFAGGTATVLAEGTNEITEGVLGEFDGTLLRNDSYILELTATDAGGNTASTSTVVDVEGDLKIGNYTLSFVDLSIPLTGIPIVVSRTYDTLNANVSDDFGYGWSMGLRDTDLTDNVGKSGLEDSGIYNAFFDGAAVYVTLPNGEREKFIFQPQGRGLFGLTTYKPRFVAADGDNTSTLTVDDIDLQRTADGRYVTLSQIPYNPASTLISSLNSGNYTLTTKDGIKYTIDASSGDLEQVTDRNGNTLTYTEAGVFSSTGKQVTFERDVQGRITSITDTAGEKIRYEYDDIGNLIRVIDQENNEIEYLYELPEQPHYLTETIDPLDRPVVQTEYTPSGRIKNIFDVDGDPIEFEYDFDKDTQTIRDAFGNPTFYEYDNQGNVVRQINTKGHESIFEYDDKNLIKAIDPNGNIVKFTYDAFNNITSRTEIHEAENADPETTYYAYNNFSQLTTITLPTGATFEQTYDNQGNLKTIQDDQGLIIQSYEYDALGRVTEESTPFGTTFYKEYDDFGNPQRLEDSFGNVLTSTYGDLGQIETLTDEDGTSTFSYDKLGRETSADYGEGLTVTYEYEGAGSDWTVVNAPTTGRIERVFTPDGRLGGWVTPEEDDEDIVFEYDKAGRLKKEIDPTGKVTSYEYDSLGRVEIVTDESTGLQTIYHYDELIGDDPDLGVDDHLVGQLAGQTLVLDDDTSYTTSYTYYADGQIKTMTDPRGHIWEYQYTPLTTNITDPLGRETTTIISPEHLPIETINPDQTSSTVEYLFNNNLLEGSDYPTVFTDKGGNDREFTYDPFGRLETATDLGDNVFTYTYGDDGVESVLTPSNETLLTYTYNDLGDIESIEYPDGGTEVFTYYETDNRLKSVELPSGVTVEYEYNEVGQETRRVSSLDGEVISEWHESGNLQTLTDETGTTTYTYDEDSNFLLGIDYQNGGSLSYDYDALGRVTEVSVKSSADAEALVTKYEYDSANNLVKVIDPLDGETFMTYDAVNRLTERILPNGVTSTYTYQDNTDLVETIKHVAADGTVLGSVEYVREGIGEPTKIIREDGAYVEFDYDPSLRLTSETFFDAQDNLIESINYGYDELGNRTVVSGGVAEGTYTHDNLYQLIQIDTTSGVETYTYDHGGRIDSITRDDETLNIEYNTDDLITRITDDAGNVIVEYAYDGMGRRVEANDSTGDRNYIVAPTMGSGLDSPHVIMNDDGELISSYVYAGEIPLFRLDENGNPIYYLTNALGSVIGLANQSGQEVADFRYDSFGNIFSATGLEADLPVESSGDFRFQGQWQAAQTDFYHLRSRYYDPGTGRFLSRDAIKLIEQEPESSNLYQFAYNNPQVYSDPTGLFTLVELNISADLQQVTQAFRTYTTNEIREFVKGKAGEIVSELLFDSLEMFLPFSSKIDDILNNKSLGWLGPIKAGKGFEHYLTESFCSIFGDSSFAQSIWLELSVGTSGKPHNNGLSCPPTSGPTIVAGKPRPDYIFKSAPPKDKSEKSYIIGDFKLRVKTLYNNYVKPGSKKDQWEAITNHATEGYSYAPFTGFITLFSDNSKGVHLKELEKQAFSDGVVALILSIK
ncbi:MAG: hypothetical protein F6K30_03040 [Cyanothece sp. SIO2G6]|nr:hypothetical protein [Cyanothece sp. SIO2G6]